MKKIIIILILTVLIIGCHQQLDVFDDKADLEYCNKLCKEQVNISCMTSYYKNEIVYCYCDEIITFYRDNKSIAENKFE